MKRLGAVVAFAFAVAASAAAAGTLKTSAVLTTEVDDLVKGGLNRGAQSINNVDLTAVWSGDNGWEAHGYVLGDFGGGFSANRVGDAQVVSNIDAIPAWRLYEAYIKKTSDDGHLITSFGLMNLNGVFDVEKAARLMENPSHGIGPEYSQTGPSIFPVTSLGAMVTWVVAKDFKVRGGVFDGVAGDPAHPKTFVAIHLSRRDGVNYITEAEKDFSHGYIRVDHWGYTSRWDRIDGRGSQSGNSGNFAQAAISTTPYPNGMTDGVNGWLRVGEADSRVNAIDRYLGYGVTLPGLAKDDRMGAAVAGVHFGSAYQAATHGQGPRETNYELTYTHTLTDRLSVQPDIQYIHRPYGRAATPDATVISLRLVVDLAGSS